MSKFQAGLRLAFETADFDELAAAAVEWDQRYDLLERGRFHGRDRFAQTSRLQFSDPHFGLGLQAVGAVPAATVTIGVADHEVFFNLNGTALDQRQLIVSCGGATFDVLMPHATSLMVVAFDEAMLRGLIEPLFGSPWSQRLPGVTSLSLRSWERLRKTWRTAFAIANDPQFDLCDERLTVPLENAVLDALFLEIIVPSAEPTLADRRLVARKARDLILERLDESLSISELCISVGTKLRTLELGFRETFGVSPKTYQQMMRLNAARKTLRLATEEETVSSIATQWNFFHFGRFSQHYRRAFGELPSDTLLRSTTAHGRTQRRAEIATQKSSRQARLHARADLIPQGPV